MKINKYYDSTDLSIEYWDRYLDTLCGNREYQKEAIKNALIYLASKQYNSINDLIRQNHSNNPEIRKRFEHVDEYFKKIQLPHKLSGTIDLATGTGKSFVMFGIAQIMLGLGIVKKVLVLCPSITIEKELKRKFIQLSSDPRLSESIPKQAILKNPRIVDGSVTVVEGDICIENIHAVYERTGSSIEDSFGFKKGFETLVLNDESHHIYNKTTGNDLQSKSIKVWKRFLLDDAYAFNYILGFTGTAYIDNDYFNDVIFRYSLRSAIDKGFTKSIDYVGEDDSSNEDQRFQKIYQNHQKNKIIYRDVRPLTILVTNNINNAKRLETRIVEFLSKEENISEEEIRRTKVITVTSDKVHEHNLIRLENVDDKDETIEWIVSVSMLTEGWDVKNVFQIVPMEERAFNSKLLIAQVLGRGLRLPDLYPNAAKVVIFNHSSWGSKIRGLVDEVLEIELRLVSQVLTSETQERSKYHFNLYNIDYKKTERGVENTSETNTFNYKGYINLESSVSNVKKETIYLNVLGGVSEAEYDIKYRFTPLKAIINKIYSEFQTREWEGVVLKLADSEYTKNNLPPREEIEKLLRRSMERVGIEGDLIDENNKRKIFAAFNTLLRKKNKSIVLERLAQKPYLISTKKRERETLSVGNLRTAGSTVFYTNKYEYEIEDEDILRILNEVLEDEDLLKSSEREINAFDFKTPVDILFTTKEPERKFVEKLVKNDNSKIIDAWLKSTNQNFYSIEYSLTTATGNHTKQSKFNPDFFIKVSKNGIEHIIVVEIKSDKDYSPENKAKYKWACSHFKELNNQLEYHKIDQHYDFHFLSPENYDQFFEYLKNGKLIEGKFISNLDNELNN
ncbi:DEAD/DEAH box helicase family protein [Euzebyella marina]|uniref:DEAD/DEAH box helicase n=1 Tax=Euzebyella marina TaxID=1761453 RepID=UPI001CE2B386|nr:DEAD/DEAH box helicase family protein [Euzebyella marina]